jgi:hypothetical protein
MFHPELIEKFDSLRVKGFPVSRDVETREVEQNE